MGGHELVVIQYRDLERRDSDLAAEVERAFGPGGLGIVGIAGVPGLVEKRSALLPLAERFANAPEAVRRACEDPVSFYNFGWSHGVETLEDGKPDSLKGSYYANPLHDVPTDDPDLIARYPSYCRPNVWPAEAMPELRSAFMDLGGLMCEVGAMVAFHCDLFVSNKGAASGMSLEGVLRASRCAKGRLLHYFPSAPEAGGEEDPAAWCGWHKDHGSLTGLTSAVYMRGGEAVSCPDPEAGLYIRTRTGEEVRVAIPADHLAFQLGEASQIHTGGLLRATPHYVRTPTLGAEDLSRSTFAVFMQPQWDVPMAPPPSARAGDVGVEQWEEGDDFGGFTHRTLTLSTGGAKRSLT